VAASSSPPRRKRAGTDPVSKPWRLVLRSPRQTHRLGLCMGQLLQGGEVVAMFGDLGTGKTSLVRAMVEGLLADPTAVSSPTFSLIHEYQGRLRLIHADLYRLTAAQANDTGLSDYLDGHTIAAIEWAERWNVGLPPDRLDIHLSHGPTATRRAVLTANGPSACRLLAAVRTRLSKNSRTREPQPTCVQLPRSRRASL
jgi:tRNA threonylcarbamoyladenosine biosynthesis protein TsaE